MPGQSFMGNAGSGSADSAADVPEPMHVELSEEATRQLILHQTNEPQM